MKMSKIPVSKNQVIAEVDKQPVRDCEAETRKQIQTGTGRQIVGTERQS